MNKSSIFWCLFQKRSLLLSPTIPFRTSLRSIPCAWNCRIWHFHLNNTLLPHRNVWNLVFATSRPKSMKLTCQFRRFLARTFRPVHTWASTHTHTGCEQAGCSCKHLKLRVFLGTKRVVGSIRTEQSSPIFFETNSNSIKKEESKTHRHDPKKEIGHNLTISLEISGVSLTPGVNPQRHPRPCQSPVALFWIL